MKVVEAAGSRRAWPRRGFTLLEAVLALAILSAVLVSALALRGQATAATARLSGARMTSQAADELFEMATEGLLPEPAIDRESLARTWQGMHLGHEYLLRAVPVERASALPDAIRGSLSDRIIMYRYTLSYGGRETDFLWHR